MKDNELLRIVQCCLPKMIETDDDDDDNNKSNNINNIAQNHIVLQEHYDMNKIQTQTICRLWAGMGHIYKVTIPSYSFNQQKTTTSVANNNMTLIVKHIVLPTTSNTSSTTTTTATTAECTSNQRKTHSYYVEANFYKLLAPKMISEYNISIPIPYYIETPTTHDPQQQQQQDVEEEEKEESMSIKNKNNKKKKKNHQKQTNKCEIIIAMSYIESNQNQVRRYTQRQKRDAVLIWLAKLHSIFWGNDKANDAIRIYKLQQEGSYWYYSTRHTEHEQMSNSGWIGRLKLAARGIADYLQHRDVYQCIIHGDAKEANILYTTTTTTTDMSNTQSIVATFCDFQYCGKGSFTKDLVYYLMDDYDDGNNNENEINNAIEFYLQELSKHLPPSVTVPTLDVIQTSLSLAYCDWYRFMIGWGGWGTTLSTSNRNVQRIVNVLDRLDHGVTLGSEEAYDQGTS
jgi:hypothetical protein